MGETDKRIFGKKMLRKKHLFATHLFVNLLSDKKQDMSLTFQSADLHRTTAAHLALQTRAS
jgi:hypothetical protein